MREKIEQEIARRGPIPFSRYMQIALYDPELGYYTASDRQFGKAGDFYTSSDVHAVFARLLARQFDEVWRVLGSPHQIEILELGPGRGLFARDVLDWSKKKFPDFFAAFTYTLQESSPALCARLEGNLAHHIAAGKARIASVVSERRAEMRDAVCAKTSNEASREATIAIRRALAPDVPLIIFANEFFDALPVEIISAEGKLHLSLEQGRLRELWLPPDAEELELLDRHSVHPEAGERLDLCLAAQAWMAAAADAIERGLMVVIDYGYTREQQLAGRFRGTLMAYRRHSASSDPYQAPGEQDLTAHVNFTALSAACEHAGMRVEKLLTQSQFLLGIGELNQFADAFEDCRLPQEQAKVALQLKHLVTPVGMGEQFQVSVASRGIDPLLANSLSGLNFGRKPVPDRE